MENLKKLLKQYNIFNNLKRIKKFKNFKSERNPHGDKLKSLDAQKKEKRTLMFKRWALIGILGPILFFILQVIWKTGAYYYTNQDQAEVTKKMPKKDITLQIDADQKWKTIKEQEVAEIQTDIKTMKKEIKEEFAYTNETLATSLTAVNENLMKMHIDIKDESNKKFSELSDTVKNINAATINNMELKIEALKGDFNTKVDEVKKSTSASLSMPPLPPIPSNTNSSNTNTAFTAIPELKHEVVTEITIEDISNNSESDFKISTLSQYETEKPTDEEITLPEFTLMPGFAKGITITGADAPTLKAKADESEPIWISVNSETLIANNGFFNNQDCLLRGTVTGEYATGRGKINVTEISCTFVDDSGQYYKLLSPIKGWVYGEDSKLGLKGRVVSREGEIIEKGLPLAAIEGAIEALSNNDNYFLPNGGTTNGNPLADFKSGGMDSGKRIVDKFSEYYLEILDTLNPTVELKAKRKVTIAFKGGEKLKLEKFNPLDVNYFQNNQFASFKGGKYD